MHPFGVFKQRERKANNEIGFFFKKKTKKRNFLGTNLNQFSYLTFQIYNFILKYI